jgi:hypothetical protein
MTALRWLLDLSDWVHLPISVAVWVVTAGLFYRWWADIEPDGEAAAWLMSLAVGFLAGLLWPWLLCFGVPIALGLGGIWASAMLVAYPPRRRRLPQAHEHWTDSLPADLPLERIVELAEQRARDPQPTRPDPAWKGWH